MTPKSMLAHGRRILALTLFAALTTCTEVRTPTSPVRGGPLPGTAQATTGIVQTLLASGNNTVNQKIYTTASFTPAPNTLVTVAVLGHNSTTAPASPTLSGGGMTGWTVVASVTFDGVSTPHKRLTVYRAMSAAPGSGPLTITFASSVSNCQWIVSQWSGVDVTGANGSGAIGQTGAGQADGVTGLTVGLAPFGNPGNVAYGVFGVVKNAVVVTPGSGFTEVAEQASGESPSSDLEAEWGAGINAVTANWSSANAAALGIELVSQGTAPSTTTLSLNIAGSGTVALNPGSRSGGSCPNPATASCTAVYFTTDSVRLTATAPSGWNFTGWSGDCTGAGSCALLMSANHSVTASFAPVASHTLSLTLVGSGQVGLSPGTGAGGTCANPTSASCTGVYLASDTVTLTATAGNFTGWSGDCSGTGTCKISMSADHAVTATFEPPSGGGGTIAHALLTSGNNAVNQKIYTTASIAPAPNALVTVAVLGHNSTTAPASPTLTGGGMTAWTVVASITFDGVGTPRKRLTIYRAMSATPGSGPLTIKFASSVSNCQWIVSQWSGVDVTGANGAGAIGQTGSNRADGVTGLTVGLGSFASANDVAYGVFGVVKNTPVVTPGSGFTEAAEQASGESPSSDLEAEWATNHAAIGATWASANAGALGIEIKAGSAGGPSLFDLTVDRIYVTQAVQTLGNSVSLVAGRAGLVRVFVRADQNAVDIPSVRVSVYNGGALVASTTIAGTRPAPVAIDESDLSSSWNYSLAGSLVHSGYSIVAEVDPDHTIPEADEGNNTLTSSENVRATAAPSYRFVPVKQSFNGLTGDVTAVNAASYVDLNNRIFPLLAPGLDVHQTYTTNAPVDNGSDAAWSQILSEIDALRVAEGSPSTYVGAVAVTYNSGIVGIGYIGRPTAVVWDDAGTRSLYLAHELGHTYGREHAPGCGADFPDRNYPYPGATIGVFGTDVFANPPVLYPPSMHDIMSYCDDAWISDYTYNGVLNFVAASQAAQAFAVLPLQRSLLVWGCIRNGEPYLEPAFVLDAHPVGPGTSGTFQVQGLDKDGVVLFTQAFEPTPVADERGGADNHFAFAVPLSDLVQSRLVALRLLGQGREFVRTTPAGRVHAVAPVAPQGLVQSWQNREAVFAWDTLAAPMVMIRDPETGQVLAIARQGRVAITTTAMELEVILSNGVGSTAHRVTALVPQ